MAAGGRSCVRPCQWQRGESADWPWQQRQLQQQMWHLAWQATPQPCVCPSAALFSPVQSFVPGTFLDQSVDTISYSDFVHKARGCSESWLHWHVGVATQHAPAACLSLRPSCRSPMDLTHLPTQAQELILFSRADLERSIPCMVDGLKPGQRKIMFACFKRNLKSDIKVAQLSGYVAEHSGGW